MEFIRLQSKKYDINENSKSYEWGFSDIYDAMNNDIDIHFGEDFETITAQAKHGNRKCKMYLEYLDVDEKLTEKEKEKILEDLWDEIFKGHNGIMVLNGVSGFYNTEEGKQQLYEYFIERNKEALNSDDYYVLVFEGDYFDTGHNGEPVAKFKCEIKRIPIKEFFKNIKK